MINNISGQQPQIGQQKHVQGASEPKSQQVGTGGKPQELAKPQGDQICLSEELNEPEGGKSQNINALTSSLSNLKLGMEPGIQSGGTMGANGIQSGFDPGMQGGAVFNSRRG